MSLQDNVLHHCLQGDEQIISQIEPRLFSGVQCQLARLIIKGADSADKVRAAINVSDKIDTHKNKMLDEVSRLDDLVCAKYDTMVSELKEKYMHHRIRHIGQELTKAGQDTCTNDDVIRLLNQGVDEYMHTAPQDDTHYFGDVATEIMSQTYEDVIKHRVELTDPAMQKLFSLYLRRKLYVISGKPSSGKTMLLENLVCDALKKKHVLYYSWDNDLEDVTESVLMVMAGIPQWNIVNRKLSEDHYARIVTARETIKNNLFIMTRKLYYRQFKVHAESMIKNEGIGLIVIDYFQQIHTPERERVQHLEQFVLILKDICHTHGIPVIALSQLSMDGGTKWCKGLHEGCFYHLAIDGDQKTRERKANICKFKTGKQVEYMLQLNFETGRVSVQGVST